MQFAFLRATVVACLVWLVVLFIHGFFAAVIDSIVWWGIVFFGILLVQTYKEGEAARRTKKYALWAATFVGFVLVLYILGHGSIVALFLVTPAVWLITLSGIVLWQNWQKDNTATARS
jgi:hypothetical protein